MKCDICGKEFDKLSGIMGIGFVCEADEAEAKRRRAEYNDALLAEPLGEMPDTFDTGAFERFGLKLALHFLKALSDVDRKRLASRNPLLLVPEELALDFKERILKYIPSKYMSVIENRGHMRMFFGGEYRFNLPVPRDVVFKALKKTKLINAST